MNENQTTTDVPASGISRRRFFGYAGALAGAGLLAGSMSGCKRDDEVSGLNIGTGDLGVLNYAYVLEQLEAAFYTAVFARLYTGISPAEQAYLQDIRDHEIAHRDLLKNFLGSNAMQTLTPNFSTVDFSSRQSVLQTARELEDLGVSAYNGIGKLFTNTAEGIQYLGLIGKIVSVEARHAAIIRELLAPNSFADTTVLDANHRIDRARPTAEVLVIAGNYFYERLNGSELPSS